MQRRLPGVEMTEVEIHMAINLLLVCHRSSMAVCPQAVQISITTVVDVSRGHALTALINIRNSAYD